MSFWLLFFLVGLCDFFFLMFFFPVVMVGGSGHGGSGYIPFPYLLLYVGFLGFLGVLLSLASRPVKRVEFFYFSSTIKIVETRNFLADVLVADALFGTA